MTALLEAQSVSMTVGGTTLVDAISLRIGAGEMVGLMGDNGAGKSTLVRIIAGNFPPSQGSIHFCGREVHFHRPMDSRSVGIEVVYQDLALANNLSAAANIFLGREL